MRRFMRWATHAGRLPMHVAVSAVWFGALAMSPWWPLAVVPGFFLGLFMRAAYDDAPYSIDGPSSMVGDALARKREGGFRGERGEVRAQVEWHGHALAIVLYRFPGAPDAVPFVEVWEEHDGARGAGLWPLAEVVHLLQNVEDEEFWAVAAGREGTREVGDDKKP